jgi:glutaredoxin
MWDWLRRKPAVVPDVVMYTRHGCHLCEEAWAILQAAQQTLPFDLRTIDVDTDPALAEQFGLCVPVVTVDGAVRFRGRVNAILLHRLLRGRAGA